MKNAIVLFLIFASVRLVAQTLNGPESVDCDTSTNTWYVSNTGSGKILRRQLPASGWQNFAEGMSNGPYGIEVVGDRIYACDGARIRGFRLTDGMQVFNLALSANFLNGLTSDDSGRLYATDFSSKKIYKIDPSSSTWSVFVANTVSTPNGIVFDRANARLVFVSWGSNAKIHGVSLADSSVTTLKNTTLSNIDGIALDGSGRVYVASWGANAVHRFAADWSGQAEQIVSGLNRPADIFYNHRTDTLGIPNSGSNTVRFVGFSQPSPAQDIQDKPALSLFPNPAPDWLAIGWSGDEQGQVFEISACSITGQRFNLPVTGSDPEKTLVQTGHLSPGLYRLEVRMAEKEKRGWRTLAEGQFLKN